MEIIRNKPKTISYIFHYMTDYMARILLAIQPRL